MASAPNVPANDAAEQLLPGDYITLDPNEIDIEVADRLRQIDVAFAEALGMSMRRDGQINAVHVCKLPGQDSWTLAGPGGHRVIGARMAGIAIDAKVVTPDQLKQRRREAAENVFRRDNDPLERAASIAELVRLHKLERGINPDKDGRAASVQARWQKALADEADDTKATLTLVYGWNDAVAQDLGVSPSLIKRDLLLYRRLAPSLVARLREVRHPIVKNAGELRALAKLEANEQARVVDRLLDADAPAKSVSDAQRLGPKGMDRTPDQKRFNTILSTLDRMGATERVGLFQSKRFHDLMPAEARRLLAPMLRDPATEESGADANNSPTHSGSGEAGLAGARGPVPAGRVDADGKRRDGRRTGEGSSTNDPALAGRSGVSGASADGLAAPKPAVAIRASVKPDYIVCLECGEKLVNLAAHLLVRHDMAMADYIGRWKLPVDYPLVAPSSEPSPDLITECAGDLELVLAIIHSWYGKPAKGVLAAIEAAGGSVRFANGTYELKLARVKTTCTAGGENLVRAWRNAAARKLELAEKLGLNVKGASK